MATVMQLFGDALGNATPEDGQYLKSMDFEYADGRGNLATTHDIGEAMLFDEFALAIEFWKRSPKCHPTRLSDGKPNRPLTAFNWTFADPEKAK
jgi:hypothetical protein